MTINKYFVAIVALFILGESPLTAQFKEIQTSPATGESFQLKPLSTPTPQEVPAHKDINLIFESMDLTAFANRQTRIYPKAYDNNKPIFFRGNLNTQIGKSLEEQVEIYVNHINRYYKLTNINQQYAIGRIEENANAHRIHISQLHNGVPVENGEWFLHATDGLIHMANGRFVQEPKIQTTANISAEKAVELVIEDYKRLGIYREIQDKHAFLVPQEKNTAELLVMRDKEAFVLAYKVDAYANIVKRYVYYINAITGEIIHNYKNFCSLHNHEHAGEIILDGTTATAKDLKNIDREINVYEEGGTFYMIDDSRSMHTSAAAAQSDFPNEPQSVIWTIDAGNTNPQNNNFEYDHVSSSNNTWSSKTAVSAHYNGGEAFEYFLTTHDRNSINGEGGNIISLINISDPETGGGFDNAFWNGQAMFYGNGSSAFSPLAEALDVAGHEMSHGVIQATANLTYQGESGAMNEAFADIFGAMMDREDWFIGEEIAQTAVFPTGRMRDMSNPHNGGNQLGDPGWQPDNVNEQFFGSQDNGGVHINSGIINFAFFKFASNPAVGKDTAEDIFYEALSKFLTKSSNFKDLRAVIEQICSVDYPDLTNIASQAFADVGIGTGGGNTDYETEVEMNPGEDFLLHSDDNFSNLILKNNSLDDIANPLSDINHRSRPSVTDNGEFIFFVGQDNNIYYLTIDWDNNQVSSTTFDDQGVWRNVIISKDGSRLAALTDQENNQIIVLDFNTMAQNTFELFNPTFTEGVSTGNVDFADAMEFDFTGENIMYDAQSTINGSTGDIVYWDIGFIEVFNNNSNNFADGNIQKLFNQLPENVSVGNPTFSKNSPHIIAFDLIEGSEYKIMGANIETSDVSEIFDNGGLGYPNYNNADNQIVYHLDLYFFKDIGLTAMENDKITPQFDADAIIVESSRFPVIFGNGERVLISTENEELERLVSVFPNPVKDAFMIETPSAWKVESYTLYDSKGSIMQSIETNKTLFQVQSKDWNSGMYFIVLQTSEGQIIKRIVKE